MHHLRVIAVGLLAIVLSLAACVTTPMASDEVRAMTLDETAATPYEVADFGRVHAVRDDGNEAVIFGALPIAPVSGVEPETAAFLGRWEGYGLGPPIKRDWKYVLAITEIATERGTAFVWAGTNLEFPAAVEAVTFRVRGSGTDTTIEWEQSIEGAYAIVRVRHASGTEALEATIESSDASGRSGAILLRKDTTRHVVHRDYAQHLADAGIAWRPHEGTALATFGAGSLVYLPPGYDAEPDRAWPLVVFLHGSGDRGDNGLAIAQNSPFRYVTQGNRLDAIVVAPLLAADQPTFPTAYLDGVLDDALATLRVDPRRVTLTGLSMGGESTYRFARHRPETFAAIAVLCGFDAAEFSAAIGWGYTAITDPAAGLIGTPVRVIHGRDDTIVPLSAAQATVDALVTAGVDVEFTILEHHDHDVWSDTYADPAFYDWLLTLGPRPPGGA